MHARSSDLDNRYPHALLGAVIRIILPILSDDERGRAIFREVDHVVMALSEPVPARNKIAFAA